MANNEELTSPFVATTLYERGGPPPAERAINPAWVWLGGVLVGLALGWMHWGPV